MKKIFLLLAAITVMSCSSSDDGDNNPCELTVYQYSTSPGPNGTTRYFISYGPNAQNLTTPEVNQATYDYYRDQTTRYVCWEGMIE